MKMCMIGNSGHGLSILPELDKRSDLFLTGFCEGYSGESQEIFYKEIVEKRNIKINIYDSYEKMLDKEKPDLLVIDGVFGQHGRMTMEALQRGIHVFVDKPVATEFSELEKLESIIKSSKARLFAMLTMRYEAPFYTAQKLIREGMIGKLRMLNGQKSYKLGKRPEFYTKRNEFGGITPWISIHMIDLILWYTQKKCISVSSYHDNHDNQRHGDMEMISQCSMQLEDHILAGINSDYYRPATAPTHGDDRLRIVGTEGILEILHGRLVGIDKTGEYEIPLLTPPGLFEDCLRMIECKDYSQNMDGLECTRVSLMLRESADMGKRLWME